MRRRLVYLWLLLPLLTVGVLRGPSGEQRQMIQAIDEGSIFAWSRHITGQDPNDLTSFDKFESVAVIPGTSLRAYGDTRRDDEVWVVVNRDVNGVSVRYVEQFQPLDWGPDPNYCWFVDCGRGAPNQGLEPNNPGTPDIPGTFKYIYVCDGSGYIHGIPLQDGTMTRLDTGGVTRNAGGGLVGLPMAGHPFEVGETIAIDGTYLYDSASTTVQAGTTVNEILITAAYQPKTFTGDENVLKVISLPIASAGRMDMDSNGVIYYGGNWDSVNNDHIIKVEEDGTLTQGFFNWGAYAGTGYTILGLKVSSDEQYLYVLTVSSQGYVLKFNLSDGSIVWQTASILYPGYHLALDSYDNAYTSHWNGVPTIKIDSDDGSVTELTNMGQKTYPANVVGGLVYETIVDDTLGIVIGGGGQVCLDSTPQAVKDTMYNLGVRTFDDSAGDTICIGSQYDYLTLTYTPTVSVHQIATDGEYIYVVTRVNGGGSLLTKLQWNGSSLTQVATAVGPTYGISLFFDVYGNLVVINSTAVAAPADRFYFYDTELNYLATVDDFPIGVMASWDNFNWLRGDYVSVGTPLIPGTPGNDAADPNQWDGLEHYVTENMCVYADGVPRGQFAVDANGVIDLGADYDVVIAGLNYFSILETTPLRVAPTLGRQTAIKNVQVNFHDSMGAHVGADMTNSANWRFFQKSKLDSGSARDANDGTVGLSYSGEPFAAGDEVYIYGSANYSGIWTLAADTNNVELRLTTTYAAETLQGDEWVVFNSPVDLFSGYKGPMPFLRGNTRTPKVYIWLWEPVPLTIRSITANMEVTFE